MKPGRRKRNDERPPMVPLTAKLPVRLWEVVRDEASERRVDRSDVVREALESHLRVRLRRAG